MTETSASIVENFEEVIERWLEYGMDLPVVHEHAVNLTPVCIKALEEVNAYRIYTLIELPIGIIIDWLDTGESSKLCPAYGIVYRFQLTDWLKKGWNFEKYKKEQEAKNK